MSESNLSWKAFSHEELPAIQNEVFYFRGTLRVWDEVCGVDRREETPPLLSTYYVYASHPRHSILSITSLRPPNMGMTHSPHFTPKETEALGH